MNKRNRAGELQVEGRVASEVMGWPLERKMATAKRLGIASEEMGDVSDKDIVVAFSRKLGCRMVFDFAKFAYPAELLALIDADQALKSNIFPLKREGSTLYLGMSNPLDNVAFRTDLRIVPCVTTTHDIQEAVNRHYLRVDEPVEKSDWWRILVVDDQDMVRLAITAALRKEGYSLHQAENGAEGLKIALQLKPHLIILDTVMPRMDGYEMFRYLQAYEGTRGIPVIALSSKADAVEEASLLDRGYYDFVAKPINPIRVQARVRRALFLVYGNDDEPPDGDRRAKTALDRAHSEVSR